MRQPILSRLCSYLAPMYNKISSKCCQRQNQLYPEKGLSRNSQRDGPLHPLPLIPKAHHPTGASTNSSKCLHSFCKKYKKIRHDGIYIGMTTLSRHRGESKATSNSTTARGFRWSRGPTRMSLQMEKSSKWDTLPTTKATGPLETSPNRLSIISWIEYACTKVQNYHPSVPT